VHNSVNFFDDWTDLLSHSSVGLNNFADFLDDRLDYFMDNTVWLVLEGSVFDLGGSAWLMALLYIDTAGRSSKVNLDWELFGLDFDDLWLRVIVLKSNWSDFVCSAGLNGGVVCVVLCRSGVCVNRWCGV
jgi:hypothetical protein